MLIEHVRERVEEGWEVFREGVMQVQGQVGEKREGGAGAGLMGEEEVRGMLRGVCSLHGAVNDGVGEEGMEE